MLNYLVIDLETSIKNDSKKIGDNAVGKNKADPFHYSNKTVLTGLGSDIAVYILDGPEHRQYDLVCDFIQDHDIEILVGHNLKFDLHYLCRSSRFRNLLKNLMVWDTQLVEYILSGQTWLYPHLGDKRDKDGCLVKEGVATSRGGSDKLDIIKRDYWDKGIDTEDIPDKLLREYLAGDVDNTRLVYESQVKEIIKNNMLPLISSQMDALLATQEMEFNGMHFDVVFANNEIFDMQEDLYEMETIVESEMKENFPKEFWDSISCYSPTQLSVLFFGGTVSYNTDVPQMDVYGELIKFKTGKRAGEVKTKKQKVESVVDGKKYVTREEWKTSKKGVFSTSDVVLKELPDPIAKVIIDMRKLKKDLTTYFEGYKSLIHSDGMVHGNLNHCSTATGRLSSTKPNLQNVTSKEK